MSTDARTIDQERGSSMDRRTFFSGLAAGAAATLGMTRHAHATASHAKENQVAGGSEPFIGQIQTFGFNFAPRGWAKCDGQLLQIASNTALFSLLGTTYGGDGRTTFGLPDLRGRLALHQGAGPGLTNRIIGQKAGAETVSLDANTMPTHTHVATLKGAIQTPTGFDSTPTNKVLASGNKYFTGNSDTDMGATSITNANTGGGQAHANMQPFLCINFCIALTGVFPSRN